MNRYLSSCILILLDISFPCFAESNNPNDTYWECTSRDQINATWMSQNTYRKIALNFAFDECKKNSNNPATCTLSADNCIKVVNGIAVDHDEESGMPSWQCAAMDREAFSWKGTRSENREHAALAAQSRCKHSSAVPLTCSINLITCINKNEFKR